MLKISGFSPTPMHSVMRGSTIVQYYTLQGKQTLEKEKIKLNIAESHPFEANSKEPSKIKEQRTIKSNT